MKWYGHLLFYLISCVVAELILVMFFALDAIANNNPSTWSNFYIPQIGMPLAGLFIWAMVEGLIGADEEAAKKAEWYKQVNEMLKDYKKRWRENDEINNDKH